MTIGNETSTTSTENSEDFELVHINPNINDNITKNHYSSSILLPVTLSKLHEAHAHTQSIAYKCGNYTLVAHRFKRVDESEYIYISPIAACGKQALTNPNIEDATSIIKTIREQSPNADIIFNYIENHDDTDHIVGVHIHQNNFSYIDSRSKWKKFLDRHTNSLADITRSFLACGVLTDNQEIETHFLDMQPAYNDTRCGPIQSQVAVLLAHGNIIDSKFDLAHNYRGTDKNHYYNYKEKSKFYKGYHLCLNQIDFEYYQKTQQNALLLGEGPGTSLNCTRYTNGQTEESNVVLEQDIHQTLVFPIYDPGVHGLDCFIESHKAAVEDLFQKLGLSATPVEKEEEAPATTHTSSYSA